MLKRRLKNAIPLLFEPGPDTETVETMMLDVNGMPVFLAITMIVVGDAKIQMICNMLHK